jgi:hypothetical protein
MHAKLCPTLAGFVTALAISVQGCSTDSATGSPSGAGNTGVNPGGGSASMQPGGGTAATQGGSGTVQAGTSSVQPGGGQVGAGGTNVGMAGTSTATAGTSSVAGTSAGGSAPMGPAIGAAQFAAGDLDSASDGGTLTFQNIGKVGSYPSRRAAGSAMCDVKNTADCCLMSYQEKDDKLTPWNEDLIVTLRGPIQVKQFVVYQPGASDAQWDVVTAWDTANVAQAFGVSFNGNGTPNAKFAGTVGSECITDVMTATPFGCGPTSAPLCDSSAGLPKNLGWAGSKLFVLTARMPMQGGTKLDAATACGQGTGNNWYNAPWIGISLGELVRENKFGPCNCYSSPANPNDGNGCGQFNAFEVVNDNNAYQNFDIFSTNFFGYGGYVGEGPCGKNCNLSGVGPADLIDKSTSKPAAKGGVTVAGGQAAHVAFRRPEDGYRYILVLFDVNTRQVQMAVIHPSKVPAAAAGLLPTLPRSLGRATIDALLGLRLPG